MAKTLPNGVVIPTPTDGFDYVTQLERLGLPIGAIPSVANDAEANRLVAALLKESNYPKGKFVHLIYVRDGDALKLHDGARLHSLPAGSN